MIPLKDNIPTRYKPYMVYTLIALNALFFLYELGLSPYAKAELFHLLGVVPARFTHPAWALEQGYPAGGGLALVTHIFLHSGWLHFLFNMWTMWIFADNVEDIMGPFRFLGFYLLCGLGALACHVFFNIDSTVPVVGASGAIAGVMGAYFLLYPHAKVVTIIPIIIIPFFIDLPAVIYLGIWFFSQIFSGMGAAGQAGGGVAWWAHIGGFITGMLLLSLFRDDTRCYYCYRGEVDRERFWFE